MQLSNFSDFLAAARAHPEAHRQQLGLPGAQHPHAPTPRQARRFEEGRGGALAPVMCVDKGLDELADFGVLADESRATGQPWDMVFVAALAGEQQASGIDRGLKMMIDAVHRGAIERFLAFDPDGHAVRFA
jgi:hypothetical protein